MLELNTSFLVEGFVGVVTVLFTANIITTRKSRNKDRQETEKRLLEIENLKLENTALKKDIHETEMKLQFLNRIMDIEVINKIGESANRLFERTIADRFLVLIAKNGTEDFRIVSVVFEAHKRKEYRINAIARYRNVEVDYEYRKMLKQAEKDGVVEMTTANMPESILKDFYETEGVKHSKVRFLARKPIDPNNDFVVFSSVSTHEEQPFGKADMVHIKTEWEGSILPCIKRIFHERI